MLLFIERNHEYSIFLAQIYQILGFLIPHFLMVFGDYTTAESTKTIIHDP